MRSYFLAVVLTATVLARTFYPLLPPCNFHNTEGCVLPATTSTESNAPADRSNTPPPRIWDFEEYEDPHSAGAHCPAFSFLCSWFPKHPHSIPKELSFTTKAPVLPTPSVTTDKKISRSLPSTTADPLALLTQLEEMHYALKSAIAVSPDRGLYFHLCQPVNDKILNLWEGSHLNTDEDANGETVYSETLTAAELGMRVSGILQSVEAVKGFDSVSVEVGEPTDTRVGSVLGYMEDNLNRMIEVLKAMGPDGTVTRGYGRAAPK